MNIQIYSSVQVFRYSSIQVLKYSSTQVFKYSSIQVFKYRVYKLVTHTLLTYNVKSRDPIGSKNILNFLLTQQNCSAQKVNFETDKNYTTSQTHLGFCLQEANCQSTFSGPGQRRSSREHLGHAWDWCSG